MTILKIIIALILIVYIINKFIPAKGVKQMTLKELSEKKLDDNIQLIDVRTRGEYRIDHLEGAVNIPLKKLNKHINELSKEKEIILICQTGIRSTQACKKLKKHGFNNLINIKGGMTAPS